MHDRDSNCNGAFCAYCHGGKSVGPLGHPVLGVIVMSGTAASKHGGNSRSSQWLCADEIPFGHGSTRSVDPSQVPGQRTRSKALA
jgi:hypothetical protein